MGKRRRDGRLANQLRPMAAEFGVLNAADGSAKLTMGDTKVLVAVYGPRPGRSLRHENPHRATLEVSVVLATGPPGQAEGGDLERAVHDVFDGVIVAAVHPRTFINVDVQVIHDDGALLPAVLNCVTLALVDAGIPIDGMVAAVSAGLPRPDADVGAAAAPVIPALAGREAPDGGLADGAPLLDLLASEEGRCRVAGAYAFKGPQQPAAGAAPVFTRQAGACSWDDTQTLLDTASTAAGTVLAFLRLAAQNKVARDGVNLGLAAGTSEAGR